MLYLGFLHKGRAMCIGKGTFGLAVLATLVVVDSALAYYSPRLGRFISRDPIGEPGAMLARPATASALGSPFMARDPIPKSSPIRPGGMVDYPQHEYRALRNGPLEWIDPDGGTDPWSGNIIWSERTPSPDTYRRIGPVQASVGPGGAITVFTRSDARLVQQYYPPDDVQEMLRTAGFGPPQVFDVEKDLGIDGTGRVMFVTRRPE